MRRHELYVLLAATLLSACQREPWSGELPLRPLLYTEAPEGSGSDAQRGNEGPGSAGVELDPVAWPTEFETHTLRSEELVDLTAPARTPDELLQAVYAALVANNATALRRHLYDADGLAAAARMSPEAARREAATLLDDSNRLLEAFDPGPASEAREGGLSALLRPSQIIIGRPRTLQGQVARENEPVAMHWGNEVTIQLVGTAATFTLRFPKILVDADGIWRLAAAPTVDQRFRAFRALGIDRKPEMMDPEHAPLPLSVGNFWHYRTRRPTDTDSGGWGVLTQDGFRDEVTEVLDHGGHRVVRFRRVFDNPTRTVESFAYLVTPLRIYRCDRDCQRHAADVSWILNYAANQVPQLSFPLSGGRAWGAGGEDGRNNVFRVQPERATVDVPSGTYTEAWEILRITPRGRESRYFVPGVGFVLGRSDAGFATTLEELTHYRVLQ